MSGAERTGLAPAKLNLALVVGPVRSDGKHEVVTLLQRVELADEITLRPSDRVEVEGFADDTLVTAALDAVRDRTGVTLAARIRKHVPVAAGLGGGSSDAATALRLANELMAHPLPEGELHEIAAGLGSDVPFFLVDGPQLGLDDGARLEPCALPQGFVVLLALPHGARKESTRAVYRAFDERGGAAGYDQRRQALLDLVSDGLTPSALPRLPRNDLASSPLAVRLERLGAIRADVSGAGPTVYGLFESEAAAVASAAVLEREARVWVTRPRWYR
jgi:4-diphosphocytidyl-2-C-methyl-D-erythritol kinase